MAQDDAMQYPIPDLETTVSTQRKSLDDAWQTHQTHLDQQILTPAATLFKSPAEVFHDHMTSWHQTLQEHYQAFHTFLDTLQKGSTAMDTQDTDTSNTFKDFNL